MDPIAACRQMRGEAMSRAMRKMPPVQGLSQPYTCPIPIGMALKSCRNNRVTCLLRRQERHLKSQLWCQKIWHQTPHTNFFFFFFETEYFCVLQAGLETSILLPQAPECTLTFHNRFLRHFCSKRLAVTGAKPCHLNSGFREH
jgi:hypothetical protein